MLSRVAQPFIDIVAGQVNRVGSLDGTRFEPSSTLAPPTGRFAIGHYGVMVPGLPDPLRSLDVVALLGNARVPIFANPWLTQPNPADSVYLLTGSGGEAYSEFACYSRAVDCDLAADGSRLAFGEDVVIEGSFPKFTVRRAHPRLSYTLDLRASDVVTHFAHIPGAYDHWSLLCEYDGTFTRDGIATSATGLCTFEYARAVDVPMPFRFFTYQIINVSDDTQVLWSDVRGPGGVSLYHGAHVRTLGVGSRTTTRDLRSTVHTVDVLTTPDGHDMRVPRAWSWSADDTVIEAEANGDWVYGLGAGYAGSFTYTGTYASDPIGGSGYVEWIER